MILFTKTDPSLTVRDKHRRRFLAIQEVRDGEPVESAGSNCWILSQEHQSLVVVLSSNADVAFQSKKYV
jgi:hypothetical protein